MYGVFDGYGIWVGEGGVERGKCVGQSPYLKCLLISLSICRDISDYQIDCYGTCARINLRLENSLFPSVSNALIPVQRQIGKSRRESPRSDIALFSTGLAVRILT